MAGFVGRALYQEYLLRRAALEQTHTQTGPRAEQPLAATKPARYSALHGVTADTGGRLHRIVRDLNRNTIDSIGQNMAKWGLSQHPTHARKRSPAHATHALQRVLASPASQHVPPVLRTGLQGDIRDQLFLESISVYMTL